MKEATFKNFAIFTVKHLRWGLFLTKLLKRDSNTGVLLKYKIFEHNYFEEHLRTAASEFSKPITTNPCQTRHATFPFILHGFFRNSSELSSQLFS